MTKLEKGSTYEFENINPNTFLHFVLSCNRCKQTMGLVEGPVQVDSKRRLCYPCYKELLKKN